MNLNSFLEKKLFDASLDFFSQLGIQFKSHTAQALKADEVLGEYYKQRIPFTQINEAYFLGLIDDNIFSDRVNIFDAQIETLEQVKARVDEKYPGIMVFAVSLTGDKLTRTNLSEITRAFNKASKRMPVVVLYKYNIDEESFITFTATERTEYKQEWREGEKIGKVTLLKDIRLTQPHTGHIKILHDLKKKPGVNTFELLYMQWKDVFNIQLLNKNFYREIADWFYWAVDEVEFPDDLDKDREQREAKNLIRLLTRIIFIWFMKEKKLVPESLFEKSCVDKFINYNDKTGSTYYKVVLQNLFFATLNTPMKKDAPNSRIFVEDAPRKDYKSDAFLEQGYYRYSRFIKDKNMFLQIFENIPFLNGGLFECLDKGENLRVDCFSDKPKNETRLKVPDKLFFFDEEINVDLSKSLDNRKNNKVTGLFTILKKYKFTIEENTPLDQDIALDPELLGQIFENLLASYNPETATTARKATGSYYTPREIVDYMVEESLVEYLKNYMVTESSRFGLRSEDASDTLRSEDASGTLRSEDASGTLRSEDASDTFFSPYAETEIYYGKHGKLPHMLQGSVWYFVTFRLADSLPAEKIQQLQKEREEWLKRHKGNFDKLSQSEKKEYRRLFSGRVEEWLNAGYGSCILKDERIASIVTNTLFHFNHQRYELDDWVIMPNHVHLLIKPIGDYKLTEILHSIKSYSAHKINEFLGRKGDVWMHESYDHIVRNEQAFNAIKNYIRNNPEKAKIKLPDICCSWKITDPSMVLESSRFAQRSEDASGTLRSEDASGTLRSEEASGTLRSGDASDTLRSEDASDTLRVLLDYRFEGNPFADNPEITLKLIDAIENIKILDPACGSGAFPMGVLHKLVLMLHKLDPENKIWKKRLIDKVPPELKEETERALQNKPLDYIRKLGLIQHCIYGVDIQEIAIQISKLRFFISLLVEQEVDDSKQNRDIRALPNLETKFVAANTLIGLEKLPEELFDSDVSRTINDIRKIRENFFYANSRWKKDQLEKKEKKLKENLVEAIQRSLQKINKEKIQESKTKIEKLIRELDNLKGQPDEIVIVGEQGNLFGKPEKIIINKTQEKRQQIRRKLFNIKKELAKLESPEWGKIIINIAKKIVEFNPYDQNKSNSWFDPEWMFGIKDGFDIVIGNPPYIQLQKAFNSKKKFADLYKDQNYETFDRTGDIYCLFYEKGIQLLKQAGILTYITSNKWMRAGYGEKVRNFFTKHNPIKLIDLGPGVFENATVDTNIILIQKSNRTIPASGNSEPGRFGYILQAVTLQKEDRTDISKALQTKGVTLTKLGKDAWFIGNDAEQKLKEKIERIGKPLKDWDVNIYRGVLTGLNEAFIIDSAKREEILANCKVTESSRLCGLTERQRTEAIIKPILRGRDIKRYTYEWAGLWVIIIPAEWTNENRGKENPEKFIEKTFPALMQHLKPFEAKAKKRDDQGDYWWELRHCAYYSEFEKEKVVYSEIVRQPQFHYDTEKFYTEATGFLMTGRNTKYICGLLNSKPVTFFFKEYYAGGGLGEEGYRYKKAFLENLPIPPITSTNRPLVNQIETLVDKILAVKTRHAVYQNPTTDISEWEKEIDQIVYKLYDLTPEEIKIIEGGK